MQSSPSRYQAGMEEGCTWSTSEGAGKPRSNSIFSLSGKINFTETKCRYGCKTGLGEKNDLIKSE